jgi:hypothetical protein
VLLAALNPG